MNYLVCINQEGVQCKFKVGKDPKKAEILIKRTLNQHYIKSIFKYNGDPSKMDFSVREVFSDERKKIKSKILEKFDIWSGYGGYQIRKTAIGKYVEVLVDMKEKEFKDAESRGLDGAIDILLSTKKLIKPSVKNKDEGAKIILKWIKRLENEKEL